MATPVWTELVCARCAEATPGQFSMNGKIRVRELRADAAARGWKFKHNECFCSTKCLELFEQEKARPADGSSLSYDQR